MLNPLMLMPHLGACMPGQWRVQHCRPSRHVPRAEATSLFSCRPGTLRRWSPLSAKLQPPVATLKS